MISIEYGNSNSESTHFAECRCIHDYNPDILHKDKKNNNNNTFGIFRPVTSRSPTFLFHFFSHFSDGRNWTQFIAKTAHLIDRSLFCQTHTEWHTCGLSLEEAKVLFLSDLTELTRIITEKKSGLEPQSLNS